MCSITAIVGSALNLSMSGIGGVGLSVETVLEGAGYAITSSGNVLLEARDGETITVRGLCLNSRRVTSTTTLKTNDDFILFQNKSSITVTLPTPSRCPGKIMYFKQAADASVTIKGIIMKSNSKTTVQSNGYNGIYSWFYISDGFKWIEFSC